MNTTETAQEPIVQQEKIIDQAPPQQEMKQDEVKEDPNWRVVRELRKKEKAEREAAEQRAREESARADALAKALEAALSKAPIQQNMNQGFNGYQEEETEDQRIEKKVNAVIAQREAQFEKLRAEKEQQMLPSVMKQHFPDYDQVVNEDNGAYLKYHYPEIYESLVSLPENFINCSNIYKAVKRLVPNPTDNRKDEIRAENNFNKPKSMTTANLTPPGTGSGNARLTEERRAQNWERMQKLLKGIT